MTRLISQWVYDASEEGGQPPLRDGVRYMSRLGEDDECWGVFEVHMDRVRGETIGIELESDMQLVANRYPLTMR